MLRARGSPARQSIPDDVYAELVEIMFRSMSPLISMGVVLACVGGLLYSSTHDFAIAALTVASLVIVVVRIGLNVAFKRRRATHALDAAKVKRWELAFGIGSAISAVLLGVLNARAIIIGDSAVLVIVMGALFAYCAGAVIRLSVRPRIVAVSLFGVASLTAFGFAARYMGGDAQQSLAYVSQALLIIVFVLGSVEMVHHLYKSTLDQLMTKSMLSHLARKDELTGLANRLSLRERFDNEIVRIGRSGDQIALHYLDLDRFKAVNDNYGHPAGDRLLVMVAERLTNLLRGGDTAARLGGDEFVVVQTSIQDPIEARVLARRLVRELSAPYLIDGHSLSIGASVGIALAPDDGLDLDQLGARADSALYQAKTAKRGSIAFWREPKSLARAAA